MSKIFIKYICEKKYLKSYIHKMVNSRKINVTGIVRKISLNLNCMSLFIELFIEFHSKRKVFGAFTNFLNRSQVSFYIYGYIFLWIYL